jgi:hypothetical protein
VDETYGHGTTRATGRCFTHTAALCGESECERIDAEVIENAFTLLGSGVQA